MANQPGQERFQELARQNAQFMAKVWSDPAFKQRFMQDPAAVLREQGVDVPEDVEFRVVENTDKVVYLIVPPPPSDDISDEQLDAVAGGSSVGTATGTVGTVLGTLSCPAMTVGTLASAGTLGSAHVPGITCAQSR